MKKGQIVFRIVSAALGIIAITVTLVLRAFPKAVTNVYVKNVFHWISLPVKFISNLLPYSLAEILFILFILLVPVTFAASVIACIVDRRRMPIIRQFTGVLAILMLFVFFFTLFGGLNYDGLTFAETSGLDAEMRDSSAEELRDLCKYLAERAASERSKLTVNSDGVVTSDKLLFEILEEAENGYEKLYETYPWMEAYYTVPKPAICSRIMSYLQISGIYPYFIPEAIVNSDTPVFELPHTICHEMAHQRGFAREDEANFIGYLAAINNDDPLYRYSGYLEAFSYSMNALWSVCPDYYNEVISFVHPGIRRDLSYQSAYWNSYLTPKETVAKISESVNNVYLEKVQNIPDGTRSYGRMVDLLLAEWRRAG